MTNAVIRGVALALLLLGACAKKAPPPPALPTGPEWDNRPPGAFRDEPAPTSSSGGEDGLNVRGTVGTLDEGDVQTTVKGQWDDLNLCYTNGLRDLPELGGSVKLKFKVAKDGSVKLATIVESNLGVFSVERCVLDVVRRLRFPKPHGGDEAEVSYPLSFPSRGRPVKEYGPELVERDIKKSRRDIDECRKNVRQQRGKAARTFTVTMYLTPNGYKRGKAIGKAKFVGYASPEETAHEDFALCVVERIRGWTFTRPPAPLTKVTVGWPLSR
jgi:TonB family protein